MFARRPTQDQTIFDNDHDSQLTNSDSSTALISIDTNGIFPKEEVLSTKRTLETTEQVFVKRRIHQSTPSIRSLSSFLRFIFFYFQRF